jgi:hypothetical protein
VKRRVGLKKCGPTRLQSGTAGTLGARALIPLEALIDVAVFCAVLSCVHVTCVPCHHDMGEGGGQREPVLVVKDWPAAPVTV